jgi:nucleoside-diphosphate-sugar epimerase
VPATSLRYFSVYGPRQRPDMAFHRAIEAGLDGREFVVYGDGNQTRDFTFVDDVVAATLAAGKRSVPGTVYNIGGGANISMLDALEVVRELTGGLRVRHAPGQRGDARDTSADIARAAADLGYAPRFTIPEGLAEQVGWHRSIRPRQAPAAEGVEDARISAEV